MEEKKDDIDVVDVTKFKRLLESSALISDANIGAGFTLVEQDPLEVQKQKEQENE